MTQIALEDGEPQDRELRKAMAKASLRKNWRLAEKSNSTVSIEEIGKVRSRRIRRKSK